MARYYFDYSLNGQRTARDAEGIEFRDAETAIREARRAIAQGACDGPIEMPNVTAIDVRAGEHDVLCTLVLTCIEIRRRS